MDIPFTHLLYIPSKINLLEFPSKIFKIIIRHNLIGLSVPYPFKINADYPSYIVLNKMVWAIHRTLHIFPRMTMNLWVPNSKANHLWQDILYLKNLTWSIQRTFHSFPRLTNNSSFDQLKYHDPHDYVYKFMIPMTIYFPRYTTCLTYSHW